jgi:hypothetical protein
MITKEETMTANGATGKSVSVQAAELSKLGARKGGVARAAALDAETRREIAMKAAAARWGDVRAASNAGEIQIGALRIACAVLEDGTRLLSQSAVLQALGRDPRQARRASRGTSAERAPFLLANNIQPYITDELRAMAENPIPYRLPSKSGRAWGYRAEMLPALCEVYLEARRDERLLPSQVATARAAEILLSGLARVGIVALVDEATGYQETRAKRELRLILEKYVSIELRPWVKTFPNEFFEQIYRLNGWEFRSDTSRRTPQVGKLINSYIYDKLPPGVHDELRHRNPRTPKGYRVYKHHQFLADTGSEHLDRHISHVMLLMRIAKDKMEFEDLLERAFPSPQLRLPLVIEAGGESTTQKLARGEVIDLRIMEGSQQPPLGPTGDESSGAAGACAGARARALRADTRA